jgi:signal transduction histidine kinase
MTSSKIKTSISVIIGLIMLLLVFTLMYSLYVIGHVKSNLTVQVHTRTVIISLKDNLTYLLDAETGERGFLITNDSTYLRPYSSALGNISFNRIELHSLITDNPQQQLRLDSLEVLIDLKLAFTKKLIALKEQGEERAVNSNMITHEGKMLMDKIRLMNQSMQLYEETLFNSRRANTNKSIANAKVVFIAEGIFALLATIFLASIIISELNRRTKTEKLIRATNRELEQKNREIEQFAYAASHDLQEPLRSIANFSTLLTSELETHPDGAVRQYMNYINGAAKRMSNLIFDLLEYSRIGNDKTKSNIDCNELMQDILTDLSASIKEKDAIVHVSPLPVVYAYSYLKSLFQNLLSNALKFHKKGSTPVISISFIEQPNEFIFSITDNGIGMEKEYYERIFIIFQRLHSREEFPGTGIGLSLCRKIVELHGGKIWIESEKGKGSTFNFTIPKSQGNI